MRTKFLLSKNQTPATPEHNNQNPRKSHKVAFQNQTTKENIDSSHGCNIFGRSNFPVYVYFLSKKKKKKTADKKYSMINFKLMRNSAFHEEFTNHAIHVSSMTIIVEIERRKKHLR